MSLKYRKTIVYVDLFKSLHLDSEKKPRKQRIMYTKKPLNLFV